MAINLYATKKELDLRRNVVHNCYICGTVLMQEDQSLARVSAEHIIPLAMLKWAPAPQAQRVPLVLNVHKACDDRHKGQADELFALLVRVIGLDEPSLKKSEKNLLRKRTSTQSHFESDGIAGAAIIVPDSIQQLVHVWARGLLAFLYAKALPSTVSQISNLPVPAMKKGDKATGGFRGIDQWSLFRSTTISTLGLALDAGCADKLVAWGGHVRFTATWLYLPQVDRKSPWTCFLGAGTSWPERVVASNYGLRDSFSWYSGNI